MEGVIGPVGKVWDLQYEVTSPCNYGDTKIGEGEIVEANGLEFNPSSAFGVIVVGDIVDKTHIQRVPLSVLDLSGSDEEKEFIREFNGYPKGTRMKLDEIDVDSQPLTAFGWIMKRRRVKVCVELLQRIK